MIFWNDSDSYWILQFIMDLKKHYSSNSRSFVNTNRNSMILPWYLNVLLVEYIWIFSRLISDLLLCYSFRSVIMAEDPQRNFRSAYYEKVGFRGVEEKRSLEILLKDNPLGNNHIITPSHYIYTPDRWFHLTFRFYCDVSVSFSSWVSF